MKRHYSLNILFLIPLLIVLLLSVTGLKAQPFTITTASTGASFVFSNTPQSCVIFSVKNTMVQPVRMTSLSNYCPVGTTARFELWYHPNLPIGGNGLTDITTANGWIKTIANGIPTFNAIAGLTPVLTNLDLVIPAGKKYRIALVGFGNGPHIYAGPGPAIGPTGVTGLHFVNGVQLSNEMDSVRCATFPVITPTSDIIENGSNKFGFFGSITFEKMSVGSNDASVALPLAPLSYCTATPTDVNVRIHNAGFNIINSVQVNWQIDGVTQSSVAVTTPINAINKYLDVNLGSVTFPDHNPHFLKVWTSFPNEVNDTIPLNDTLRYMIHASFSGSYTIGTIGRDFRTMNEAAVALTLYGVCGPTSIEVDSAVYPDALTLLKITGTNAIDTVTINGNGAKTFASNYPSLQMRMVNYFTIKNLTFELSPGSTIGSVGACGILNYCRISHCRFISDMVSTIANINGLAFTAENTSSTFGTKNSKYNIIENSEFIGGYTSLTLAGAADAMSSVKGNLIRNNIVRDFRSGGIAVSGTDSTIVSGNDIHRLNRVNSQLVGAGIWFSGKVTDSKIYENRVHHLFEKTKTTTAFCYAYYSLADAVIAKPNIWYNNLADNIESTGLQNGIFAAGCDYNKFYFNTIVLKNAVSGNGIANGISYSGAASGVEFLNNNIYISRPGPNPKYGINVATTNSPFQSDYNNFYISGSGSSALVVGRLGTTDYPTLASWQMLGGDANSTAVDPVFVNPSIIDYRPNSFAMNNMGTPIPKIVTDINGITRDPGFPDIGAFEYEVTDNDVGILSITQPITLCVGTMDVSVKAKNFGSNVLDSFIVNWSVNGVLQMPYHYSASPLAIANESTFTIGSYVFNSSQIYTIKVWTSAPNNAPDPNNVNDTIYANNLRTGLNGVFTVGGISSDYPTIKAAADDLNLKGVCGPVVFEVNRSEGPYNQQVVINTVKGGSNINTVTFSGNGSEIQYTSSLASDRAAIKLIATSYVTIDSFVINGFQGISTSIYSDGVLLTGGSSHNVISRNRITVSDSIISTNFYGILLSSSTSAPVGGVFNSNRIENNIIRGGYYGIFLSGITASPGLSGNNIVINNRVYNSSMVGIYVSYQLNAIVKNNDISRPTRTNAGSLNAIHLLGLSGNTVISGNKIHSHSNNTKSSLAFTSVIGIYLENCNGSSDFGVQIYNNLIYDYSNTQSTQYGIYNVGSSKVNCVYNTIILDDTLAVGSNAYAFYQTNHAEDITIKNNLIYVTRSGTGFNYGYFMNTPSSTFDIDNNYIYVKGSQNYVGSINAVNYPTLALWKTANSSAFDQSSFGLLDPKINSSMRPVLLPGSPAIGKGVPIAMFSKDILGVTRSLVNTTPGAYENAVDVSGPQFSFIPIPNTLSNANLYHLPALVTITDTSGIDTSSTLRPRIYYKRQSDEGAWYGNTATDKGWKYVSSDSVTSPFGFTIDFSKLYGGSVAIGDRIEYFIIAQNSKGVTNVIAPAVLSTEPTSVHLNNRHFPIVYKPLSFKISEILSGIYRVGTNEDRKSITKQNGIFEMINDNIVAGDVEILISSDLIEDGSVALNPIVEIGTGNYHITFRPDTNINRKISGSYAGGLIRLDGADRITFDGRFQGSGSYLKFENTNEVEPNSTFLFRSTAFNYSAHDNVIRNCVVLGGKFIKSIPIQIGDTLIPYGYAADRTKIIQNTILRGSIGIFCASLNVAGSSPMDSLIISDNIIGSDDLEAHIRVAGIRTVFTKNALISGNVIKNIKNPNTIQSAFERKASGISCLKGFMNGQIIGNNINLVQAGAEGFGGRGIEINSNSPGDNISIVNNFVARIGGPGAVSLDTNATFGIGLIGTGGIKVYFNSVSLSGDYLRAGSSTVTADRSAALFVGTGSKLLDIRNNTFSNTINTNGNAVAYAMYSSVLSSDFTRFDYNNYFVRGVQSKLGFMLVDINTIANMRLATSANLFSISGNPIHLSDSDLHVQGTTLYRKGTPLPVATDIDQNIRFTSNPCIGADEFLAPSDELRIQSILYPNNHYLCANPTDSVVIVIQNLGIAPQTNFPVNVSISGPITRNINTVYTQTLMPNMSDTFTVGYFSGIGGSGIIDLRADIHVNGDVDQENDTLNSSSYLFAIPTLPVSNPVTICKGQSATLIASSSEAIRWFSSMTSPIPVSLNDTFITPPILTPTTYYVSSATAVEQSHHTGLSSSIAGIGITLVHYPGLIFDVINPCKLESVVVYPISISPNTPGTIQVELVDISNTVLKSWIIPVIGNPEANATPQTILLNANLLPGTNYKLRVESLSQDIGALKFELGSTAPGGNHGFPFSIPGLLTIKYAVLDFLNTPRTDTYCYFYDWKVTNSVAGCLSDRMPVNVFVAPIISGSIVDKDLPFNGTYNDGTSTNPDGVCILDTITYKITAPTGYLESDFGVTWTLTNASIKKESNNSPSGTVTMNGLNIQYIAAPGDLDSMLVFRAKIKSITTSCDSDITRFFKIFSIPVINLPAVSTMCQGDSIILDAGNPGYNYLWSNGKTTQRIKVGSSGTYTVAVIGPGGCKITGTAVVNVLALPIVSLGPNKSICPGSSIVLDPGTTTGSFLWSTGAITPTIRVSLAGTYTVKLTNSNGCISRDTIVISNAPIPVVNLGVDRQICKGDSITLDAGNPGATYLWSTNATTKTITVKLAGVYSVRVTNSSGCISDDDVIITNKAEPNANFTIVSINNGKVSVAAVAGQGIYNWDFGDGDTSTLLSPTHTYASNGTYTITLTVHNLSTGCEKTTSQIVTITNVGIGNLNPSVFNMQAYPNPFTTEIKLKYTLQVESEVCLEVYDLFGRKVDVIACKESQDAGIHEYIYDKKELTAGLYIVKLKVNDQSLMIKISKSEGQ